MPDNDNFEEFNFDELPEDFEPENDPEGDESEDLLEIDPSVVAFMDQKSAEHNANAQTFLDHYGFVHDCRCDLDYSDGNMVEVTRCFADMTEDALDACERLTAENKLLQAMITQAIGLAMADHFQTFGEDNVAEPESTE